MSDLKESYLICRERRDATSKMMYEMERAGECVVSDPYCARQHYIRAKDFLTLIIDILE